jgi:hypothetical protein
MPGYISSPKSQIPRLKFQDSNSRVMTFKTFRTMILFLPSWGLDLGIWGLGLIYLTENIHKIE